MTYAEKLKDPRWQKKRLEIMQLADFACEMCDDKDSTLHVHHRYYVKGRLPWQYPNFALQCLCSGCHNGEHPIDEDDNSFSVQPWESVAEAIIGGKSAFDREIVNGGAWDLAFELEQLANRIGKAAAVGVCLHAMFDYWVDVIGKDKHESKGRRVKK